MSKQTGYLVVGGDSLVGGGLLRALERRDHRVLSSTRRLDRVDDKRIYLDFESDERFKIPFGIDYVFLVAAATNYDRCESDPLAHRINVELIPRLALSLLAQGVFVTFVSTNSVFGGEHPWPQENDPPAPGIAYAKQKFEAERLIKEGAKRMSKAGSLNIVRLTKVLDRNISPLPSWFDAWSMGKIVQPFSDLIFAPMSVEYVGESLATIGEKRVSGNLHLSGAENVSYVDLALSLAEKMSIDLRLIEPTTAEIKGIHIPFKPRFSGLGMSRTNVLTGLKPQSIADVAQSLVS